MSIANNPMNKYEKYMNEIVHQRPQMIKWIDCSYDILKCSPQTLSNRNNSFYHKESNGYAKRILQQNQLNNRSINNIPPQEKRTHVKNNKSVPPKTATLKKQVKLINDKLLSPKTLYNFSTSITILNKSKSVKKIDSSQNNKTSIDIYDNNPNYAYSSVEVYWQKRKKDNQEKMNRIQNEKFQKEQNEIRDKPMISKNSLKIANKLRSQSKEKVFDRLSSGNDIMKKLEELKRIQKKTSENHPPKINSASQNLKRTVDDLLQWKMQLDRKKNETINYFKRTNSAINPKISQASAHILKLRKPDYINKKVEDRLIEQGARSKEKIEEQKEHYIEYITLPKKAVKVTEESLKNSNYYANVESRYSKEPYIKGKYNSSNNYNKQENCRNNKQNLMSDSGSERNSNYIKQKENNTNSPFDNNKAISENFSLNNNLNSKGNLLTDIRKHLNEYYQEKKVEYNKSFTGNPIMLAPTLNEVNYKKSQISNELTEQIMQEDKINKDIPQSEPFQKNYQNFEYSNIPEHNLQIEDKKQLSNRSPLSSIISQQNPIPYSTPQYEPSIDIKLSFIPSQSRKNNEDINQIQSEYFKRSNPLKLEDINNNNHLDNRKFTFEDPLNLNIPRENNNNYKNSIDSKLNIDNVSQIPQYKFDPQIFNRKYESYKEITSQSSLPKENMYYPNTAQIENAYTNNSISNAQHSQNSPESQLTNKRVNDLQQVGNYVSNIPNDISNRINNNYNQDSISNYCDIKNIDLIQKTYQYNPIKNENRLNIEDLANSQNSNSNYLNSNKDYSEITYSNKKLNEREKNYLYEKLQQFGYNQNHNDNY